MTVDDMKKKHGLAYTQMQYQTEKETINESHHSDLDKPPSTSMFTKAGN